MLPARCKLDLHCSGALLSVKCQFVTEVSGQLIGPITLDDVTDNSSRNFGKKLPFYPK
jgi:hypothetical protein